MFFYTIIITLFIITAHSIVICLISQITANNMSTSEEADIERYLKESVKSYKECSVKNSARRNSLQKKTLGIESERRLANSKLSREERLVKDQLRHMNMEKAKNHLVHNLRGMTQKSTSANILIISSSILLNLSLNNF